MSRSKIVFIAVALAVVGCAAQQPSTTPSDSHPATSQATLAKIGVRLHDNEESYQRVHSGFPKLREGMTKAEVAAIVGLPRFNRDSDVWQWEFRDTGMADKEVYVIEFQGDRLVKARSAGLHYANPDSPSPGR